MEVVSALQDAGAVVEEVGESVVVADSEVDAIVDLGLGGIRARFAVEEKLRAPYPNELSNLAAIKQRLARHGSPLLVVPFVSESLARSLTAEGWSWADGAANFDLRADGLVMRQRKTSSPPRVKAKSMPQGPGSLGIVRALIRFSSGEHEAAGATSLAAQAKVSQPRASQVLRSLLELELVTRTSQGRWVPNREALLDRFLAEYRGPGGSEQHLYCLDSPTEVARRAAQWHADRTPLVASADVGPDLMLAWRRPSVVIIYSRHLLEPSDLELVVAQGRHDANVIVRNPDDTSVFPVPAIVADLDGVEVPLADVAQQIWDLQDLGGADRLEAAGMLRTWLLNRP